MAREEDRPLNSSLLTRILTPNLVAILSFILVVSGHAVSIHFFRVDAQALHKIGYNVTQIGIAPLSRF
jgi:hypothetical protein